MKKTVTLIFAASTLFLAGCCTTHEHAKIWEYKTVEVTGDQDVQLNHLAEQGWRVESFTATFPSSGPLFKVYLLKRPKQ